jgi:hypothetical protein
MTIDPRAISAARNNADLYEAVFQAHGLAYHRTENAFVADDPPPPYYAHITTVSPAGRTALFAQLSRLADRHHGVVGLKDSFCTLDPATTAFELLFQASWIWRQGPPAQMPEDWQVVTDPHDLEQWEADWKANGSATDVRMFPASLLATDAVVFLGQKANGHFTVGCLANRSVDCIGLSNVFAATPSAAAFAKAADAAALVGGGLPVVGYETGGPLDQARQAGFDAVGNLRVLVSRDTRR